MALRTVRTHSGKGPRGLRGGDCNRQLSFISIRTLSLNARLSHPTCRGPCGATESFGNPRRYDEPGVGMGGSRPRDRQDTHLTAPRTAEGAVDSVVAPGEWPPSLLGSRPALGRRRGPTPRLPMEVPLGRAVLAARQRADEAHR